MTTDPTNDSATTIAPFVAEQATLTLQLIGAWGDEQAAISYGQGRFYMRPIAAEGRFAPEYVRALDGQAMRALSAALTAQLRNPPAALDVAAVRACVSLLATLSPDNDVDTNTPN